MADINNLGKIIAVTGHYGSGKTNLAVNLAVDFAKEGERVTIIDLDIVNPYFRTADFSELFGSLGIKLVAPQFANTNLDIPSLGFDMSGRRSSTAATALSSTSEGTTPARSRWGSTQQCLATSAASCITS